MCIMLAMCTAKNFTICVVFAEIIEKKEIRVAGKKKNIYK